LPRARGFQTPLKRASHFAKHGRVVGCLNEIDYEKTALAFFARTDYNIRVSRRPRENDVIYYDYQTNEFGVLTRVGYIRTYFKPNTSKHLFPRNLDYYFAESIQLI
jgi:pyocin large subunit-like protein